MRRKRLLGAAAALLAAGCGPYAQVILYAEGDGAIARGRSCVIEVYENDQVPPADLVAFGDVFVGDTGFTYLCTELSKQTRVRQEACAVRAEEGREPGAGRAPRARAEE
jgi:hypothetical protein